MNTNFPRANIVQKVHITSKDVNASRVRGFQYILNWSKKTDRNPLSPMNILLCAEHAGTSPVRHVRPVWKTLTREWYFRCILGHWQASTYRGRLVIGLILQTARGDRNQRLCFDATNAISVRRGRSAVAALRLGSIDVTLRHYSEISVCGDCPESASIQGTLITGGGLRWNYEYLNNHIAGCFE